MGSLGGWLCRQPSAHSDSAIVNSQIDDLQTTKVYPTNSSFVMFTYPR